jgi:hypothetical protein
VLRLPRPFSHKRTTTCARLNDVGAGGPYWTLIHILRSVGLTGGEVGGSGGGACSASSMTTSPASLEKRRSGGAPLRAAMVPKGLGGVVLDPDPLASRPLAAVSDPFATRAEGGDPDGGEEGDLQRRRPATGEGARVESIWSSTGSSASDVVATPDAVTTRPGKYRTIT